MDSGESGRLSRDNPENDYPNDVMLCKHHILLPFLILPIWKEEFGRMVFSSQSKWLVSLLRSLCKGRNAMLLPTNGCSLELCIPFLKLTNKEQASISWKPGPLAANVTRNMIGAAANSYMHVVGSL